jgi:hypothetical protein
VVGVVGGFRVGRQAGTERRERHGVLELVGEQGRGLGGDPPADVVPVPVAVPDDRSGLADAGQARRLPPGRVRGR